MVRFTVRLCFLAWGKHTHSHPNSFGMFALRHIKLGGVARVRALPARAGCCDQSRTLHSQRTGSHSTEHKHSIRQDLTATESHLLFFQSYYITKCGCLSHWLGSFFKSFSCWHLYLSNKILLAHKVWLLSSESLRASQLIITFMCNILINNLTLTWHPSYYLQLLWPKLDVIYARASKSAP